MSNIIDEQFLISKQISDSFSHSFSRLIQRQKELSGTQNEETAKILIKFINNTNSDYLIEKNTDTSKSQTILKLLFCNPGLKTLNILLMLNFNSSPKYISTHLSLLEENKPFKIQTLDQRIIASKIFSKSYLNGLNKISISFKNGAFKIVRPIIFSSQEDFEDIFSTKNKEQSIQNIIKNAVRDAVISVKPLLRQVAPHHLQESASSIRKFQEQISKKTYRYILRSPIEPAFDVSFGTGKYDTMEWLTKEEISSTASLFQSIVTDFSQFRTHLIYINPNVPLDNLKKLYVKEYFSSNDEELNSLKQKAMPPCNRVNMNMESKYVYNIIQINESIPINLKRINVGGFSQISKAQAEFWYMLTVSNIKMAKMDEFKKDGGQIVNQFKLKKQNKKSLVFKNNNYKGTQSGRNRIAHQIKIVSKFKGASSIFLPEYFKITNPKSPFLQYLIMEYLPYPTLDEYNQLNKNSISFLTKIHLASLIIQSLRFLKTYQIVHMDLKPSNIIVSKRMIIKLIDFGESFNKQSCQNNFKPAFSMPYGSPQVFDAVQKTEFTQKNDVYSWGVMIFQLLFRKIPFMFSREEANTIFRERTYMNYMHFVPEEEQKYGSIDIIPLLRNVIFRALDKDIKNRPCTLWLTVLLKEFCNYMINLQINSSIT